MYSYKKIVKRAKLCKENVKINYTLGVSTKWSYYFAKSILDSNKSIEKIKFSKAKNPKQSKISRQIPKKDYVALAKKYVAYVEKNKSLPNYLEYEGFKLKPRHLTVFFAKIVLYQYKHKTLPKEVNFNWKWFIVPFESGNDVYDYFVKKNNYKPQTLDDILSYVSKHFDYEFYFDDKKSNKQVTDDEAGNCTDLLQWLMNMTKALGYESKCMHVQCRVSGTGHVYGKFKHPKYTEGEWVTRDIACVADGGSIRCVWCSDGYVLAVQPDWFLENLNR